MSNEPLRILVVGGGAIGGFYGGLLARQGHDVAVVCRGNYAQVQQGGFDVQSPLGHLSFRPSEVLSSPADYRGFPDYLLLCVKVIDGLDRAALIQPAVGPETTLVLIENGIHIESDIAARFPNNPLISGLAFVAVSRAAPAGIVHRAYGDLVLGLYGDAPGVGALERLAEAFRQSGIACDITDDVETARWGKCVWNASFNPVSVLAGGVDTATILSAEGGERLIRSAMREVTFIAAAEGHPLPDEVVDLNIERTRAMPPYKTSMALDFEHGRPMEVDAVLGRAVSAAHRLGVPVPVLETLLQLMKIQQRRMQSVASQGA